MTRLGDFMARTFGAQPSVPPPDEPVDLATWVSEFEARAVIARLATVGIVAYWVAAGPTPGFRSGYATRGSVMVRFADLPAAQELMAEGTPLDDLS